MTKFIAQLNGGDFINIRADEMRLENEAITVYHNGKLVAFIDPSIVLSAHLSEKEVKV